MNFVDVQPRSFLDYAWTTPTPALAATTKLSRTTRKQNRCCDQCRKGKRACDAAILEDTLNANGSGGHHPIIFHYSDVFGSLAACGNCEKTKKSCTFEWLRSQRVLQATPQSSLALPAKKRRKSNLSAPSRNRNEVEERFDCVAPHATALPDTPTVDGGDLVARSRPVELGVHFADFPGEISSLDAIHAPTRSYNYTAGHDTQAGGNSWSDSPVKNTELLFDRDSGQGSSLDTPPECVYESPTGDGPYYQVNNTEGNSKYPQSSKTTKRKRRRSSSSSVALNGLPYASLSLTNGLLVSTNNTFLTDGLLRIYHDSFENALSCWLTERTCPYSKDSEVSLANDAGPDWNRIYCRVFRLDRLAAPIRGRNLTFNEDRAASRAINLAIFSFATQWAQTDHRSKSRYPFQSSTSPEKGRIFSSLGNAEISSTCKEFDRTLQASAWHKARSALQDAAEIESFRVVLAQLVFSLTQRPPDADANAAESSEETGLASNEQTTLHEKNGSTYQQDVSSDEDSKDATECGELLSKLNLAIDAEGPPVHLEQGLRLIHSLRSRMAMKRPNANGRRCGKSSSTRLDTSDKATVDLLFWLGVTFDTLSSAMHKRPLIISDEDSDIYTDALATTTHTDKNVDEFSETCNTPPPRAKGVWDDFLSQRQRGRRQSNPVRWPCSYEQAASLLCDAAPIKVLLFRKVTRIQTLLSRNRVGDRLESAIEAALEVYYHWNRSYAPFLRDCIDNHDSLPARLQSWYICLAGHWHLAALLLADLVEIIDDSEASSELKRRERITRDFITSFRQENCQALSNLAGCACPREGASFPRSKDFHFAMSQGAILTEPWTAVLIRAFAKAGAILLESDMSKSNTANLEQQEQFRHADACVKALWYLGRKSDMAFSAAKILGEALTRRRKGSEEQVNEISSFLEAELWEGFETIDKAHELLCDG